MASANPPINIGGNGLAAYASTYNSNLGYTWVVNGNTYKMIKTSAALSGVASQVAVDSGTTVYNNTCAAVSSAATHRLLGIFPVGQVSLASGDFCVVQASGIATCVCGAATTAGNGVVSAATGRVTDTSGTYAASAIGQMVGVALQTQTTGNSVAVRLLYLA